MGRVRERDMPVDAAFLQVVTPDMADFLQRLKTRVRVGVVGGSDLVKIKEQLGADGEAELQVSAPAETGE